MKILIDIIFQLTNSFTQITAIPSNEIPVSLKIRELLIVRL